MVSKKKRSCRVVGHTKHPAKIYPWALDNGSVACISKKAKKKNVHEQCSCYFSFGSLIQGHPPNQRKKVIFTWPSTSSQETVPTAISAASSTKETDKVEGGERQQQIEWLREELHNILHFKKSLEHYLSISKFGSDKDMSYYTGLTYGQFVVLFKFLNVHGICHRLNFWGSDYAQVQLPHSQWKGWRKRSLEPEDDLFLTLCRLRVNIPDKVLADNYNVSVPEGLRIFATWLHLLKFKVNSTSCLGYQKHHWRNNAWRVSAEIPYYKGYPGLYWIIEKSSCFCAQFDALHINPLIQPRALLK